MSNLTGIIQFGSPEAVIAESISNPKVGHAIFSTEKRFDEVNAIQPEVEGVESRLIRLVGRKILFMGGMHPIKMGSEMVVVGDSTTGEVCKYAYLSTDPAADAEIEEEDYRLCRESIGLYVVEKSFEVVNLHSPVLMERQPWLNVVPLQEIVPDDEQDRQADEIAMAAESMFEIHGLCLDGSSLEVDRNSGKVVVLDTCLVDPADIFRGPKSKPLVLRRSWHSLGDTGDTQVQAAA